MHLTAGFAAAVAVLSLAATVTALPAQGPPPVSETPMKVPGKNPKDVLAKIQKTYHENTLKQLEKNGHGKCTKDNIQVRKAWGALSKEERKCYLDAVKCMAQRPAKTDQKLAPGARNRRDDYVYAHINQTDFIHESGLLLPWHRQYVWAYEQEMRQHCGYQGAQPYWDWETTADDQTKSAVFDGSETSFGGNGKAIPHSAQNASMIGLPVPFPITRPAGTGGGCLAKSGGLGSYTVNLGPVAPAHNAPDNQYGTQYNPRCMTRDFLPEGSKVNLSMDAVAELMQTPDIHAFRPLIEFRMHPNAHSFVGGDLFDLFSSPNDPVFFLLHSQIDRLWSLWQGQDLAARTDGLDGSVTFLNLPPSPNATLATVLKMGEAGGDVPIKDVMSPTQNKFCYIYE